MSEKNTPRTDAIRKLIRDAINEPDRERQIALREGAECGIEQLERELAKAGSERDAAVKDALTRIADQLRKGVATIPAPEPEGTPESAIISGLCIALCVVETELATIDAAKGGR